MQYGNESGYIGKMLGMNLKGMYYAFKTSLETHRTESMTTDQFVSWLVSSEWDDRRNRAVERAIRQASFRYKATIEEIDFSVERGAGQEPYPAFGRPDFCQRAQRPVYYRKRRNR